MCIYIHLISINHLVFCFYLLISIKYKRQSYNYRFISKQGFFLDRSTPLKCQQKNNPKLSALHRFGIAHVPCAHSTLLYPSGIHGNQKRSSHKLWWLCSSSGGQGANRASVNLSKQKGPPLLAGTRSGGTRSGAVS